MSIRRRFLFHWAGLGQEGKGKDGPADRFGSEAESQLVCLKGQEWRSTASWNAVCSRVSVYTGGVESPRVQLVAFRRAGQETQWEVPLLSTVRSHHDRSGLCFLLQLLSGRLCFPDNHCFCHQHVGVLLLGLLDCHGEGLMLVHIIISCDYNPFLDPGL